MTLLLKALKQTTIKLYQSQVNKIEICADECLKINIFFQFFHSFQKLVFQALSHFQTLT
jgi:hypothetical protein